MPRQKFEDREKEWKWQGRRDIWEYKESSLMI